MQDLLAATLRPAKKGVFEARKATKHNLLHLWDVDASRFVSMFTTRLPGLDAVQNWS